MASKVNPNVSCQRGQRLSPLPGRFVKIAMLLGVKIMQASFSGPKSSNNKDELSQVTDFVNSIG
jgi:hypothetical protein